MITKLPEWYKILNLQSLSTETLENRSETVKKSSKTKTFAWMLDCIRCYLAKPIKDTNFKADLTKIFLDADPVFNQTGNDFELRVLCGAIINDIIENSKSKNRVELAVALQTALFGIEAKDLINIDIIESANTFLNNEANLIRDNVELSETANFNIPISLAEINVETLTTHFTNLNKQLAGISKSLNSANRKIEILEEESNIQWWIFKSYSNLLNIPFSEMPQLSAPIVLGEELCGLTNIFPPPANFQNFLNKILKDSFSTQVDSLKFKDVINGLETSYKEGNMKPIADAFGNITPISLAASTSLLSDESSAWPSIFEKASGIKANLRASKEALAKQSYYENILNMSSIE